MSTHVRSSIYSRSYIIVLFVNYNRDMSSLLKKKKNFTQIVSNVLFVQASVGTVHVTY